jgi:hypothetical protein
MKEMPSHEKLSTNGTGHYCCPFAQAKQGHDWMMQHYKKSWITVVRTEASQGDIRH